MTVKEILDNVIKHEGGYVNNNADRGGPTNMGITLSDLSRWYGRQASIDELKGLTQDQAEEYYERFYYTVPRFDTLPKNIQSVVVDTGVLYGTKRAIKFMQQIVNEAGFGPIAIDGILGPITRAKVIEAATQMGPFFINAMVEERKMASEQIVAKNPSQKIFLTGWMNRANSFIQAV